MKQTPQPGKPAFANILARNVLEVEVATQLAVDIHHVGHRHDPGEKPQLTTAAAPRARTRHANKVVAQPPPLGATTLITAAPRTDQKQPPGWQEYAKAPAQATALKLPSTAHARRWLGGRSCAPGVGVRV